MAAPTGYGPRHHDVGSRWSRLCFNGDERNYELWETKFLGHLRLLGLKDTILNEPASDDEEDEGNIEDDIKKNEEVYAEMIQFLDDKSLSLVMRDATDNGRKALAILRDYYAGKGKPRVISLYTELTSLQKSADESVTDYIIRAETAITALRNAEERLSDGLLIAMILKGLPESYKPFTIHITQGDEHVTFADFKTKLRSFEDTEKYRASSDDNVMKASAAARGREIARGADIVCYNCGVKGHMSRACPKDPQEKQWCRHCRSASHKESQCRRRRKDDVKQVTDERSEEHAYLFQASHRQAGGLRHGGLMVDTGATSHIITDIRKFRKFDPTFQPEKHFIELADGTRANGVALKRGDAEVSLVSREGETVKATLRDALFIPTYPQDIFSVKAATANGASIKFQQGHDELVHQSGTEFDIVEHNRLYYLDTVSNEGNDGDFCNGCYDIQTWHEILGHCNYDDVSKLQDVVEGMQIKGKFDKSKLSCETCTKGKFVQSRNREPDSRAKAPLELIHTDLAGPVDPVAKDGFKYALAFTDDYSSTVFVYFLKAKSDTTKATERFLADISPYGRVKCIRSDNGTEYTGQDFQSLLSKNSIRHETSAPYSPHQNGTAERNWRTLFDMARCMLIESNLPKELWTYAVMTAAVIRNRCFSNRTKQTPYYLLTGKKPNLSRMRLFGSVCYAYKHDKKKLDSRCEKGVFVGYDKNSPSYLVYYPNTRKVFKHRLVKFITKSGIEKETQTDTETNDFTQRRYASPRASADDATRQEAESSEDSQGTSDSVDTPEEIQIEEAETRYPRRDRRAPQYLSEYVTDTQSNDQVSISVDFCYRMCDVPQTFKEAMSSPKAEVWAKAMQEEIESLKENDTFTLTTLPEGKHEVGGRWVYAIKSNADQSETYKARYVAKGYNQVMGIDYKETFSPTANLTSVRILMQMAAQYDLELHQMDVKTAYLHAPIDCDVYMEQPEGFEVKSDTSEKLVCKLNKSLYGLKQSGRNWNKMLSDYLTKNEFVQNPADHCVYTKQAGKERAILVIWVDDLLIAASNDELLNDVKKTLAMKFNMKDLGKLRHFLGIDFKQKDGMVKMNQTRYISKVLERFGMSQCKPRSTPCEQKIEHDSDADPVDAKTYREVVGSLIYIMTCTRPDLSWVVSKLSQHLSEPNEQHWLTAKHVMRYLKGTLDRELCYKKSETSLKLVAYSDSDWAADLNDRRSTTGYCFSLTDEGPLISWKSKKQATVALSTCEAEYMALAATTQESLYLIQLMNGIEKDGQYAPVKIFEDNQGTIALSKDPVCRQRCKHIDIRYHFVREAVNDGKIVIEYCPTVSMVADAMTKPMTPFKMKTFVKFMFGG